MSDLKRLDETLDWYDKAQPVSPDGPFEVVHAAARAYRDLLANGQRVEWCEEHASAANGPKAQRCRLWLVHVTGRENPTPFEPCRMVSKLLIDPPSEEK